MLPTFQHSETTENSKLKTVSTQASKRALGGPRSPLPCKIPSPLERVRYLGEMITYVKLVEHPPSYAELPSGWAEDYDIEQIC